MSLRDSLKSFASDALAFVVIVFAFLGLGTSVSCFGEKVVETTVVASPDGRFVVKAEYKSRGVIGGHCEMKVERVDGTGAAEFAWGEENFLSRFVTLSWADPQTVSVRFAEDELSCLHEGRDLVAREVVVGSTHVRIRFEPDSRIERKH
jgi:hypothetical protein